MDKTDFENGVTFINGLELHRTSEISWQKHPKFDGVYTKNLFNGKDSNNQSSAMLVKIEPNCEIGNHIHEGKAELHEVLSGTGRALTNGAGVEYKCGVISLIPADIPHSVKAGSTGIILLALFTPPLN